jgi:2,4-dienoyl-CoA reductase-like NADH-dependent reductase (Old Yellow Enzyme family)
MTTYSSNPDGTVSEAELAYLRRRAAGGFGLVVTAASYVHPTGKAFDGQWGCHDDSMLPSLAAAAGVVHGGGALACLQIHHGGRACPSRLCGGGPWSASAIAAEREGAETPEAMTEGQIAETVQAFAEATRRARSAGFDAVEIHGANTYLLQQFVSPHSNRREDAWGTDRLLFASQVVDAVLDAADGMAVGYRFSPEEPHSPGIRWPDTAALIEMLAESPLDYLHLSTWDFRQGSLHGSFDGSTLGHVARAVGGRKPLVGVGKVLSHEDAEECRAAGADLVALGRAALLEPEWPALARAGGPYRTRLPRTGAAESLTWPSGIAERAYAGSWFELEQEPQPD